MMKKHGWWIITLILIGGFISLLVVQANRPGKYDTFAQCVADSGAKFYGAWWCPHCHEQKILFGRSAKLLPYVECQTKSREQLAVCQEANIQSFPTWVYADGARITGVEQFADLAAKTGCELPPQE